MMKRIAALLLAAMCLLLPVLAEEAATPTDMAQEAATPTDLPAEILPPAEDITMECGFNGYEGPQYFTKIRDNVYKTYWESVMRNGAHSLTITPPEGKTVGAILIRWMSWPLAVAAQVERDGEWVTVATCEADFMAQYIPIPDVGEFRIISRDDNGETTLRISEITVMTPGELPEDFQIWQKPPEKVDMMLVATHPDDEVLWFGGLLPTYAGEQGKDVLVLCAAHNNYYRRLELCDSLWACGVRIYPHFMHYEDSIESTTTKIFEAWGGRYRVLGDLVTLYRQYRPDVVALQAVGGESGHPAHRALSEAGRDAVALAAQPEQFAESAAQYGTWDVPKVYVHLWEEDRITMDWHVPLERFGGLDGMEVAAIAFDKHVSQREKPQYSIHDGGETDCSLFGLFHTAVGPDVEKNDMFEHIPVSGE